MFEQNEKNLTLSGKKDLKQEIIWGEKSFRKVWKKFLADMLWNDKYEKVCEREQWMWNKNKQ